MIGADRRWAIAGERRLGMQVGVVCSQAGSGTDAAAIRAWAQQAEVVSSVIVLPQRQTALVAKQLATLDLLSAGHGWERVAEEAVALGCAELSSGFDRLAEPGAGRARHLAAVLEAKPRIDAIVGAP